MNLSHKISGYNRYRKWELFQSNMNPNFQTSVIDIGYSDQEYSPTDNYIEKFYPWPEKITALGVDDPVEFPVRYPHIKVKQYDGAAFPFENNTFDIVWSNAVIEHVGDYSKQLFFLKEVNRVGKKAFITTPNRHFPVEVHTRTPFLHFLPKPLFDSYLQKMGKGWASGDYMHLLSLSDLKSLLHDAGINNFKILKNRLMGFVLDFVIIF